MPKSQVKRPEDAAWGMFETRGHVSGLNEAEHNLCCAVSHARLGSRPAGQRELFCRCHEVFTFLLGERRKILNSEIFFKG